MAQKDKIFEIAEYAVSKAFDVRISPDDDGNIQLIDFEFGDISLTFDANVDSIIISDVEFSGNYESFVANMNILRIFEKIGEMLKGTVCIKEA